MTTERELQMVMQSVAKFIHEAHPNVVYAITIIGEDNNNAAHFGTACPICVLQELMRYCIDNNITHKNHPEPMRES